jgi:hypothetical protein
MLREIIRCDKLKQETITPTTAIKQQAIRRRKTIHKAKPSQEKIITWNID